MGTMIDEHIKRMGDIRSNYNRWSGLGLTPNEAKTFDFAVDIMRKYQKIEQIYSEDYLFKWINDDELSEEESKLWREVCEVIENGNVD